MFALFDAKSKWTNRRSIALFFLVVAFISTSIHNPATAAISTDTIPYGIDFPGGTFDADDPVTFTVNAGSQSNSLGDIVGFDITFTLTEYAVFPTSLTPDFANSWIADGDDMNVTVELDSEAKTIRIHAERYSGSKDGYGEIVSFTLTCDSNQTAPSAMLDGEGGGIMITIDDIILRKPNPNNKDENSISVYPNPTQGKVFIDIPQEQLEAAHILDNQGREVARFNGTAFSLSKARLPKGIYWMQIRLISGAVIHKAIHYAN